MVILILQHLLQVPAVVVQIAAHIAVEEVLVLPVVEVFLLVVAAALVRQVVAVEVVLVHLVVVEDSPNSQTK